MTISLSCSLSALGPLAEAPAMSGSIHLPDWRGLQPLRLLRPLGDAGSVRPESIRLRRGLMMEDFGFDGTVHVALGGPGGIRGITSTS